MEINERIARRVAELKALRMQVADRRIANDRHRYPEISVPKIEELDDLRVIELALEADIGRQKAVYRSFTEGK